MIYRDNAFITGSLFKCRQTENSSSYTSNRNKKASDWGKRASSKMMIFTTCQACLVILYILLIKQSAPWTTAENSAIFLDSCMYLNICPKLTIPIAISSLPIANNYISFSSTQKYHYYGTFDQHRIDDNK